MWGVFYMPYNNRIFTPVGKKRRGSYFKCETCGTEFYVYPSQIKKSELKGTTIRYYGMACYDKTGENNPFWGKKHRKDSIKKMSANPNRPKFTAENNPNFVRFGEEYGFSGKSNDWWSRKLLREVAKCERCGFNDKRALCMHHVDRNRKNNIGENLELLCWNCHVIEHFDSKDGMYSGMLVDRFERGIKV